jgi:hypothetical protein
MPFDEWLNKKNSDAFGQNQAFKAGIGQYSFQD